MKKLSLDSIKKWHADAKEKCIICARVAAFISVPYLLVALIVVQANGLY
jgi:hypothetical protein